MDRSRFLLRSGAFALAPALGIASPALAVPTATQTTRTGRALVLSGGGARGAYQAGVVEGLRRAAGLVDGQPFPDVGVIVGSSIGALNGHFVATAQYGKLAELWHTAAKADVFKLKRRFAATANPHAFIIVKIIQALSLAQGLTTNVQGILDGDAVERWIEREVDPSVPLLIPYVVGVTNLDRQRAELFYRLPFTPTTAARDAAIERIRVAVGPETPVRPASDELLGPVLRASTSIPILFDPVILPVTEGSRDRFIDAGIADNAPIDVGRALARSVSTILVDPVVPAHEPYANAFEIAAGSFAVSQRRIFEASLRAAAVETEAKRLLESAAVTPEQRRFLDLILAADLDEIRPAVELPVESVEFDRQEKIDAAYALGVDDAAKGFTSVPPPIPVGAPGT